MKIYVDREIIYVPSATPGYDVCFIQNLLLDTKNH